MRRTTRSILVALAVLASVAGLRVAAQRSGGAQAQPPKPLTTVAYLGHDKVAGCANGGTLVNTPDYMVQCSHRSGPGVVEIHTKETDIFYVLDGAATFVTGGKATGVTAADTPQPRGKSIDGGEVHQLTKGDVVVVPAGTPHWFKEVPGEINYFVVKQVRP